MPFAGFDSLSYPKDPVMAWLKANTNFSFVGFYLAPAPSRPDSDWMDRRSTLSAQGWGFAPVYVGQQEPNQPGSHILTPQQGEIDARDAAGLMTTAGFPAGSVVYLDIEQGGALSPATSAYVKAWVETLAGLKSFTPGVYCSHSTAATLVKAVGVVRIWTWNLIDLAPQSPTFPTADPSGSGVAQAVLWQHAQNKSIAFTGGPVKSLAIDLDCASVPDPSQPPATNPGT